MKIYCLLIFVVTSSCITPYSGNWAVKNTYQGNPYFFQSSDSSFQWKKIKGDYPFTRSRIDESMTPFGKRIQFTAWVNGYDFIDYSLNKDYSCKDMLNYWKPDFRVDSLIEYKVSDSTIALNDSVSIVSSLIKIGTHLHNDERAAGTFGFFFVIRKIKYVDRYFFYGTINDDFINYNNSNYHSKYRFQQLDYDIAQMAYLKD